MHIKKFMLATAVAAMGMIGSVSVASAGDYSAIATNAHGDTILVSGYRTMESARMAAVRECRAQMGGSCDKTVAERTSWYYAGVTCDGVNYVGGSSWGFDGAVFEANKKGHRDNNFTCSTSALYHDGEKYFGTDGNY
jgi:hypothetical protein